MLEQEPREGLIEQTQEEGPLGFLKGLGQMFLPRAGLPGQRGLGDILSEYVEFSRLGDVFDLGAALDPDSGLDPLERVLAAAPFIGGGLAVGRAAQKAARPYYQRQQALAVAAQEQAIREVQEAQVGASMLPHPDIGPAGTLPATPQLMPGGSDWTPERARESARFFEVMGFRGAYPEAAAIWDASSYEEVARAWFGTDEIGMSEPAIVRGIGWAIVNRVPGRYGGTDMEAQAVTAAKHAIARWEVGVAEGIIDPAKYGAASRLDSNLMERIVSLEAAIGGTVGPNWVLAPHTRVAKVTFSEENQARVLVAPAGELLPDRVWDWDRGLPIEGPSNLSNSKASVRRKALDYQALTGQFAANLARLAERAKGGVQATPQALWYPRANATVKFLHEATGIDPHMTAGILSAMSAQTAWVPDNLVGAIHSVLRVGRPDLVPGSPEYLDVFRGAIEAGGWQHDLFEASAKARRSEWAGTPKSRPPTSARGLDPAVFNPMYEHYGNPANLMSEQGNLLGLDTDSKKRKVQAILEAGLPPWMVLRMFKTGTFYHTIADPEGPRGRAVIDVHNDRATLGTVWLGEALGQRGVRKLQPGEIYIDPLTGESISMELIEEQRPRLEAIGWEPDQIDSFFEALRQLPSDYARDRYLAQAEAHSLLAEHLGVEQAHQIQAATWPVVQGMDIGKIKKQLKFIKSLEGISQLTEGTTWDDSIVRLLEGNALMERAIVGEVWDIADRHDGHVPSLEELTVSTPSYTADQPILIERTDDGTGYVWADRSYPGVRELLRHAAPTGIVVGGRELHLKGRPRKVISAEVHALDARGYVDEDGRPAAGEVRTWVPADPEYKHPGLEPGEWLVVEVPSSLVGEVNGILDSQPNYYQRRTQNVRKVRTLPAVKPIPPDQLAELRGPRLERFLENNDWVTIEAVTDGMSPDEKAAANRRLYDRLRKRKGVSFLRVEGWWEGERNQSFLVTGLSTADKVKLMKDFDQYAIATPHGIYDTEGNLTPAKGFVFGSEARAQSGYTVMPNGEAFSLVLADEAVQVDDWAGAESPLRNREDPVVEVAINVGGQWGGPTWRDVERLSGQLRELGPIRFYTHGRQHVRPGYQWVSESVYQDGGVWGSAMYAGEGDAYARHRVDVLVPAEDAAGLGAGGWEAEATRREPLDARRISELEENTIWFDQDFMIETQPGAEVKLDKAGPVFKSLQVDGKAVTEGVLDLNGIVPTLHVGLQMPGPQPGMIPVEFSNGDVKTLRPIDPGDWVDARDALNSVGLFEEGAVEFPTYHEEGDPTYQPTNQLMYDQIGIREPLTPQVDADRQLVEELLLEGIPADVALGSYGTPELRAQLRDFLVGVIGDGHPRYEKFRSTFGPIPKEVFDFSFGIKTSDIVDWDGQKYGPWPSLIAATSSDGPLSTPGIVINERNLYSHLRIGTRPKKKRWFINSGDDVSPFQHILVHEFGHFMETLSGYSSQDLFNMDPTPVRAKHFDVGEYGSSSTAEYVAEVFARAVFRPQDLTPGQEAMIDTMLAGVRKRFK